MTLCVCSSACFMLFSPLDNLGSSGWKVSSYWQLKKGVFKFLQTCSNSSFGSVVLMSGPSLITSLRLCCSILCQRHKKVICWRPWSCTLTAVLSLQKDGYPEWHTNRQAPTLLTKALKRASVRKKAWKWVSHHKQCVTFGIWCTLGEITLRKTLVQPRSPLCL